MPQMAPLMWLNLFIFFSLAFILLIIMNYFLKPYYKIQPISPATLSEKLIWKW